MSSPRHTHNLVRDSAGREICSICHQVVIKPILSSDDPRLVDAGFHRSGGNYEDDDMTAPPLPEVLIGLYYSGPAIGLPHAPVAPYIELVAQEEGRRFDKGKSKLVGGPDYLWEHLCEGWLKHVEKYRKSDKR